MIDWRKPGQVVNVGFTSDIRTPFWDSADITFYVDSEGRFFGAQDTPKFNPFTGEKIESVNEEFAENDYPEEDEDKNEDE